MNIDLAALRALERERDIPYETILTTIETALLTAYRHTEGADPHARVEVDRKTGIASVFAQEMDAEGAVLREWDDTPADFGRIAAMTAKQVILQRLREATDEVTYGEYVGKESDIVTGVIQAHESRAEKGIVVVDLGKIEALLPTPEQVPGEPYEHGQRIKCVIVHVVRGSPCRGRTRIWSSSCSAWRCRRSPTAPWRSARSPGRPATAPRSRSVPACPASTPRARASARWAPGCGR